MNIYAHDAIELGVAAKVKLFLEFKLEQCPAKSPLPVILFQIFKDKQKKSNARIEMYG